MDIEFKKKTNLLPTIWILWYWQRKNSKVFEQPYFIKNYDFNEKIYHELHISPTLRVDGDSEQ